MTGALVFLALLAALTTSTAASERIWSVAIGHEWGGHEYFDDAGYLQGFGFGIIDLVCTSGNMDCRIVWDKYDNCWDHGKPGQHPSGGIGLMSRWYDACTGWVPTLERIHTFQFSVPYMKQDSSYFFVLKGNKNSFDASDMMNKNIAFLDGWANNEQCLARQNKIKNNVLKPEQIKIYSVPKDVMEALRNGAADAIFTSPDTWTVNQLSQLDLIDMPMMCFLDGNGMISRKDNAFTATWNVAFRKLRDGRQFQKFCDEQNKLHGHVGTVDCVDF